MPPPRSPRKSGMAVPTRLSAIERLRNLPPVFRGADLTVRFQWTSKTASHYLYLWKRRGLVQALGGHSDVYANCLTGQSPDWEGALKLAMPSAILIGIEALRRAGWTTQIPQTPAVAVNPQKPVFRVDHFQIERRSSAWFEKAQSGVRDADDGLRVLRPAWALADLLSRESWGACGLWPDDVDPAAISEQDKLDWKTACAAFGVSTQASDIFLQDA